MNLDLALAEAVLVVHLLFIAWVMFGALLVSRHPILKRPHIISLVYGIIIEVVPWPPCPLTILEQTFEQRAGVTPYQGSFLVHYLDAAVYPHLPVWLVILAAVTFCAANLVFYAVRWRRLKAPMHATECVTQGPEPR
jgi:hypothetical protein